MGRHAAPLVVSGYLSAFHFPPANKEKNTLSSHPRVQALGQRASLTYDGHTTSVLSYMDPYAYTYICEKMQRASIKTIQHEKLSKLALCSCQTT